MSVFKEFFYWTYYYLSKFRRDDEKSIAKSAYLLVSSLQILNVSSLIGIAVFYMRFKPGTTQIIIGALALVGILGSINHFYLFNSRNQIFRSCDKASVSERRNGKLLFLVYIILTVALFFGLGALLQPRVSQ